VALAVWLSPGQVLAEDAAVHNLVGTWTGPLKVLRAKGDRQRHAHHSRDWPGRRAVQGGESLGDAGHRRQSRQQGCSATINSPRFLRTFPCESAKRRSD